jgi:hypothetical protein
VPVSRTDVDAAIGRAQARVAELGGRLFEIDAECERLAAQADLLQGASAALWRTARDQVTVMWAWYQALTQTVASIAARRQSTGLDRGEADEVWRELNGLSVELPAESVELAGRCLPDEALSAPTWAIDPLARFISKIVEGVAETVTSLVAMRDVALPKLDEMDAALARCEAAARAAGLRLPNEAAVLTDRLGSVRAQLAVDPMGVRVDCFSEMSAAADRIGRHVEAALAELGGVGDALDLIAGDIQAGLDSLDRARLDGDEVNIKIARPPAPPSAGDTDAVSRRLAELATSLGQARQHLATGDRAGASRLAGALGPRAAELRATAEALACSAARPLARRRELRGRLDAYRAKADSLGRAEDLRLSELYRMAENALYMAPCDLDESERRLGEYQAAVLAQGTEGKG